MESQSLLKYLRVSLTTKCDKQCWYCFREGISDDKPMMTDVDSFRWLIGILKSEFGLINVRFTGGEPMMNPYVIDFINAANEEGIQNIGLTTNGYLLSSHMDNLIEAGVNSFAIHYTDIDNENWSGISEQKLIHNDKRVRYNVVVNKLNLDKVMMFVEYCNRFNIDILLLDLINHNQNERKIEYYCSMLQIEKVLNNKGYKCEIQNINCMTYSNQHHTIKIVYRYTSDLKSVYCTHLLNMHPLLLLSDYNFKLCNHFGTKELCTREIIESRNRAELIDRIKSIINDLKLCDECHERVELID